MEAEADNHRGKAAMYAPAKVTDGKDETYWTTDDGITTGSLVINLTSSKSIKYVVLQEYIIGYKRIIKLDPVTTDKVRVTITSAKASPLISAVEVY